MDETELPQQLGTVQAYSTSKTTLIGDSHFLQPWIRRECLIGRNRVRELVIAATKGVYTRRSIESLSDWLGLFLRHISHVSLAGQYSKRCTANENAALQVCRSLPLSTLQNIIPIVRALPNKSVIGRMTFTVLLPCFCSEKYGITVKISRVLRTKASQALNVSQSPVKLSTWEQGWSNSTVNREEIWCAHKICS